jgi:putative ABC transport system substrate-binding protein
MSRAGEGALLVLADMIFLTLRAHITESALKHRLPCAAPFPDFVAAGGLFSYAADYTDMDRRVAGYVDRILKGSKPAELPVEQPTKFVFAINMKTAKALGVTIPGSILLRADRVVE